MAREYIIIESARKNGVFASKEDQKIRGYIPREIAEEICGRSMAGTQWFTREESAAMRSHPEFTKELVETNEASNESK